MYGLHPRTSLLHFGKCLTTRGMKLHNQLARAMHSEVMARHFPRPARDAVVNVVTGGIPRYSGS